MNDNGRDTLPRKPWWVLSTNNRLNGWVVGSFSAILLLFVPGFVEDFQAGQAPRAILIIPVLLDLGYVAFGVASLLWVRRHTLR